VDIVASRAQLRTFLRHRRATLARLCRVNEARELGITLLNEIMLQVTEVIP
jgi:hypothetical protein